MSKAEVVLQVEREIADFWYYGGDPLGIITVAENVHLPYSRYASPNFTTNPGFLQWVNILFSLVTVDGGSLTEILNHKPQNLK